MPNTSSPTTRGWFKSSFSATTGECVEVRFVGDLVQVRDTKDRGRGPVISLDADQWDAFVRRLASGEPIDPDGALAVERTPNGAVTLQTHNDDTSLRYTRAEWEMFMRGVRAGEFERSAAAAWAS
ncbi:DUF397 domain-containing protein [Saccharothrix deserti]|uniref:DUF397 domain-containing protein n=1 Tax=Saccharothrix deserti TaxID=2593674 RepID=UPI00131D4811|nr:DUF397 domain-containing protein [Saccharothrix deserti]